MDRGEELYKESVSNPFRSLCLFDVIIVPKIYKVEILHYTNNVHTFLVGGTCIKLYNSVWKFHAA